MNRFLLILILFSFLNSSCNQFSVEKKSKQSFTERTKNYINGYLTNYYINEYCKSISIYNINNKLEFELYDLDRHLQQNYKIENIKIFKMNIFRGFKFYSFPFHLQVKGQNNFLLAYDKKSKVYFLNGFQYSQFELFLQKTDIEINNYNTANQIINFYSKQIIQVPDYNQVSLFSNSHLDTSLKEGYYEFERYFYASRLDIYFKYQFRIYIDKSFEVNKSPYKIEKSFIKK